MPWKERSVVQERVRFVEHWLRQEKSVADLCREFGISRKTGYKTWHRFLEAGARGLEDWDRRPGSSPHATPAEVEQQIVELRALHRWGPKKIRQILEQQGVERLPAESTIAAILKRRGLVRPQRRRGGSAKPSGDLIVAQAPNDVWCVDFKGWFWTGNGTRCEPVTVMDSWSRYLLGCQGLFESTRTPVVQKVFERLFEEYGVPAAILSDNGAPWASTGAGGLTQLSVWWIKLGIFPLRIYPGRPQENGRLERLHRTLKQETAQPPAFCGAGQQARFDEFRARYNHVRPHEALGQVPPAQFYTHSQRRYAGPVSTFDYPEPMVVRRVYATGQISFKDRLYYLSSALRGEAVGLQIDQQLARATVYLGDYPVGVLDLASGQIAPPPRSLRLVCQAGVDQAATTGHLSALPLAVEMPS